MDLFTYAESNDREAFAPLAARMRPRTLDEFVGQKHIVGPGKMLRRAIEADRLSSLIFHGPPGTGKTTLARIIAETTESFFTDLNAVTAGVSDIREVVKEAKERRGMYRQRTTLFIDEIHRFNKSQQDALLPYVEDGTIILIGATTENPFFEVNGALLSRSQLFQLYPLTDSDLAKVLKRAITDKTRGYGQLAVQVSDDAAEHLIQYADGDARRLLNALELAVTTTNPDESGCINIDLETAVESIQRRSVRYDKTGDNHYDTISAFIKSIRGSDPDAALYWLARMIDAGEDGRFIARRLVIAAAEDIGNADPQALQVAVAAYQAYELVGMPEGRIPLAQVTAYLASVPKSNAAYRAIDEALSDVRREGHRPVPLHLRDAHYKGAKTLGHGKGYLYPHDYPGNYVAQNYLPDGLEKTYYRPVNHGVEKQLKAYLERVKQLKKSKEK